MIEVKLLGKVEIKDKSEVDDGEISFGDKRRLEQLFLYLLAQPDFTASKRAVTDDVFDGKKLASRKFVQRYFHQMDGLERDHEDRAQLELGKLGYLVDNLYQDRDDLKFRGEVLLDLSDFRTADLPHQLELYRGVFLAGMDYVWAEDTRKQLENVFLKQIEVVAKSKEPPKRTQALSDNLLRVLHLYAGPSGHLLSRLSARTLFLSLINLGIQYSPEDLESIQTQFDKHSSMLDKDFVQRVRDAFRNAIQTAQENAKFVFSPDERLRQLCVDWRTKFSADKQRQSRPLLQSLVGRAVSSVLKGEGLALLTGICIDIQDFESARNAIWQMELLPKSCWNEPTTNGLPLYPRALNAVANYTSEMGYPRVARAAQKRVLKYLAVPQYRQADLIVSINHASTFVDEGNPSETLRLLQLMEIGDAEAPILAAFQQNLATAKIESLSDLAAARTLLLSSLELRKDDRHHYLVTQLEFARLEFYESEYLKAAKTLDSVLEAIEEIDTFHAGGHLLRSSCFVALRTPAKCPDQLLKALILIKPCHASKRFAHLAEQTALYLQSVSRHEEAKKLLSYSDLVRTWFPRTPYEQWQRNRIDQIAVPLMPAKKEVHALRTTIARAVQDVLLR